MTSFFCKIYIISVFLLVGCLAAPDQPSLSVKERVFFKELEQKYGCIIERDIDWLLIRSIDKKERGRYFLQFKNIPCDEKINGNIDKYSFLIAKIIYVEILESDNKYNEIELSFKFNDSCREKNKASFKYSTDRLIVLE